MEPTILFSIVFSVASAAIFGAVAVVLSPAEFDRLEEQDRIRREAQARLRETISSIQREAAERGLTDVEVEQLMADES